ncbi:MAG TPA: hypothetical protein PK322_03640 [Opitutaceae bacterium]|nr:hypothetical protein [Opitutaceae bacterium]
MAGVLATAGLALRPIEAPAWAAQIRQQPALEWRSVEGAMGQGLSLGLLGGFRALAADLLWLRANVSWERNDLAGTAAALQLVGAVDPRPVAFWLNGARMIGYDMPYWRIEALGGEAALPATVVGRVHEEQARVAIAHLRKAFVHHPDDPLLHIEIANFLLQKLGDLAGATEHYRRAAQQPTAPFYAARVHAELLRRQGRDRAAYDWLLAVHPTLPPERENPYAMADTVLARIRELEEKLALAPAERYQPGRK